MKAFARIARLISLLAILLVALVPVGFAGAQDGEADSPLPLPYAVFHYLPVAGGSMVDQTGGVYLLTLTGAPDVIRSFASGEINMSRIATANFIDAWAESEGLTADAELQAGDVAIHMVLSAPVYSPEAGTLAFTASAITFEAPQHVEEPKDGWQVPAEFGETDMVIGASLEFQVAWASAISAMASGIRDDNDCAVMYGAILANAAARQQELQDRIDTLSPQCAAGEQIACMELQAVMHDQQNFANMMSNVLSAYDACMNGPAGISNLR